MCSTACWSWDARNTSASHEPERGRGHCGPTPDPCNICTAAHCFISDQQAPAKIKEADYSREPAELQQFRISADDVLTLELNERERSLKRVVVY